MNIEYSHLCVKNLGLCDTSIQQAIPNVGMVLCVSVDVDRHYVKCPLSCFTVYHLFVV